MTTREPDIRAHRCVGFCCQVNRLGYLHQRRLVVWPWHRPARPVRVLSTFSLSECYFVQIATHCGLYGLVCIHACAVSGAPGTTKGAIRGWSNPGMSYVSHELSSSVRLGGVR